MYIELVGSIFIEYLESSCKYYYRVSNIYRATPKKVEPTMFLLHIEGHINYKSLISLVFIQKKMVDKLKELIIIKSMLWQRHHNDHMLTQYFILLPKIAKSSYLIYFFRSHFY